MNRPSSHESARAEYTPARREGVLTSREAAAQRANEARFGRTFLALVIALVAACGILLAIAYLQGPRLADAQVDASAAISRPDQQLRLFFTQPVDEVASAQVTVEPATEVSVSTAGELVTVQFASPLDYGTDYTVRLADVRSSALPTVSTVEYRFSTPEPTMLYLDRGTAEGDEIARIGLTGSDREVVYRTEGIQEFAATGQVLAVTTADDAGSRLQLVSLADGAVEEIRLPEPGMISQLSATDVGSVLVFTFTPLERTDSPFGGRQVLVLDLEAGRQPTALGDLGGEPLEVTTWDVVPGTRSVIAVGLEQNTFLVDTAPGSVPLPLGRFTDVAGLARDGSSFVARDSLGGVIVTLPDGETERFEPSLIEGALPFLGQTEPLPNGSLIEKAALLTRDGTYVVVVAVDDRIEGRVLYQTPNLAGSIEDFHVSPNGQYVAIEVVPVLDEAVSDGYAVDPRSTTITTVVVEISTGLIVRSVEGFALQW